ncbi:hypothetical protein [Pasteurella bettyae]|uniref:hypothetical protein n=1 Tax=Pasteurella bettyae TaxID=752 RepID=UPI003D2D9407
MQLPDNYFLDTDDEMLEYLEKQALQSYNDVKNSNENNREKAYRLLHYLLLGIGSISLLLINSIDKMHPLIIINAIMLTAGWTLSAFMLTHYVLMGKVRQMGTNIPQNLYNESFKNSQDKNKLGILRRYELHNTNLAILHLLAINAEYRKRTDTAIMIAISLPILLIALSAILLHYCA